MELNLELPGALPLTAEDFASVPIVEGVRMELEEGNLVVMASAQMAWHSLTAQRIANWFNDRGTVVAVREVGVVVGPRSVSAPDITVFRAPVTELRRSQFPAADVQCVVEVVSPDSTTRDRVVKPMTYAAAGIPEFWLVEEHPDVPSDAVIQQHRLTSAGAYAAVRTLTLAELEETR